MQVSVPHQDIVSHQVSWMLVCADKVSIVGWILTSIKLGYSLTNKVGLIFIWTSVYLLMYIVLQFTSLCISLFFSSTGGGVGVGTYSLNMIDWIMKIVD